MIVVYLSIDPTSAAMLLTAIANLIAATKRKR